ncbi:MAG: RibD family protein [Pseudomonadota bacterium]
MHRPNTISPSPVEREPNEIPTLSALNSAAKTGIPLVVSQLGQSLDGRIATETGHSHYINGEGALVFLHQLRAAVDAVVVGAGTAVADDPQLTVRRADGRNPARVLIDPRRRAGSDLRMLSLCRDNVPRVVFGPPRPGDPDGILHPPLGPAPTPADIVAALAERGFARLLIEGGAETISRFLAAGVVDRLCVAVAPLLIGSGRPGLTLPPIATLESAQRPPTTVIPLDGDVLFDCDLRG